MNNNVYVPRPDGNGGYKAPKRQAQIRRKSKADIKAEGKSRVFNAIIIVLTIILFFSTIQTKICQPHSGVVSFAPWQEPESATISIWADYDKEYI